MAETAPVTQYRNEYIHGFEQRQSLLRDTVTTEAVIKGNTAVFLVADSGGATAKTRGVNGFIPPRADNNTQNTCTLEEKHDLVQKTGFNIFQSQGDQRRIMQETSMGVINRDIDQDILTGLGTATNDTGTAVKASMDMVVKSKVILGVNEVPFDGQVHAVISPAYAGYLEQTTEFASADYVNMKPLAGSNVVWEDRPKVKLWSDVYWCVHPNISGVGTIAEKCFMYHRSAIGHAADTGGMQALIGYDEEQDYSWARATIFMGSKLLQNSGVVVMNHDGSAFAAS